MTAQKPSIYGPFPTPDKANPEAIAVIAEPLGGSGGRLHTLLMLKVGDLEWRLARP